MSTIVTFAPNVPVLLSLKDTEGQLLSGRFKDQVCFQLSDGRDMVLDGDTAAKLYLLELKPGEQFSICKKWDGENRHPMEWSVWVAPQTEKTRAKEERESLSDFDFEEQLQRSIEAARNRVPRRPPAPERSQPQVISRGTGTNGPAPMPAPAIAAVAAPVKAHGKIPYNVACREILHFVTEGLKSTGEQWNDQAKQDLISTFVIAAAKQGLLQVWERDAN